MPQTTNGSAAASSPSVFIIEPDATVAHLLALALSDEGYAVETAPAPYEALALLAVRGPHAFAVVLSAPCAPPRAPYAWLDRLRVWTRAPIVICTRQPAARYAEHRARGFMAVIEEPCELQDIVTVVASLCAGAAVRVGHD